MEVPTWMIVLFGIILFFLGGSVYSFLNVVIFRVPRKEEFIKTRSHCPGCGRVLKPYELIPVVSFACLGGKCRTCGSKIGLRDVAIEILGGCLCILSFCFYFQAPVGSLAEGLFGDFNARLLAFLTAFAFIGVLTVVSFIDLDTMEIPQGTVIAVLVLAVLSYFTMPKLSIVSRLIGGACVSIPMFVIALLVEGGFGGGDIKLMTAAGLLLGWRATLAGTLIAFFVGGAFGIVQLLTKKKKGKDQIPFGPYLCIGMLVALFYGEELLNLYLGGYLR